MFNSITKKIITGFSAILIILTVSTAYNIAGFMDNKKHIMHIKEVAAKSLEVTNDMKNNIIQTRLYIEEISASKDMNRIKKAEEYAGLFLQNANKLIKLDDTYKKEVKDLNDAFNRFFEYGKIVAQTYVDNGHEEGNMHIDKFDKLAEDVFSKVDAIQKNSQVEMDKDLNELNMHISMKISGSIIIAVIIIGVSLIIAILLANGIKKPIRNLVEIFHDLEKGQGDLTKRIQVKSKDEIGIMAESFNRFMDSMENMVSQIKSNSVIVSQGAEALSQGGHQTKVGIVHLDQYINKVAADTQKISDSISQITESIVEIARASQDTSVVSQEICNVANDINTNAQESGKLALEAKNEMEKIERISADTIRITEQLGKEANEIGKITDTIKTITDQTNLLALNAAIEAARAGEHGRGFGVVAEEIRQLAENNNQSAKMIELLIQRIHSMIMQTIEATTGVGSYIKEGRKIVENVHMELQNITTGITHINDKIQNIAASTEEQSTVTEELSATMETINGSNMEIATAVVDVASSISGQTDTISQLSAIASELNNSAELLSSLVNNFKLRE